MRIFWHGLGFCAWSFERSLRWKQKFEKSVTIRAGHFFQKSTSGAHNIMNKIIKNFLIISELSLSPANVQWDYLTVTQRVTNTEFCRKIFKRYLLVMALLWLLLRDASQWPDRGRQLSTLLAKWPSVIIF